jgi:hypothetical protein
MLYFAASPDFPLLIAGNGFSTQFLGLILMDTGNWRVCQVEVVAHPPALPAR